LRLKASLSSNLGAKMYKIELSLGLE